MNVVTFVSFVLYSLFFSESTVTVSDFHPLLFFSLSPFLILFFCTGTGLKPTVQRGGE
jgi:hypothetical protein